MIGNNTIEMNQATLNAAVEHYLNDKVLREPVTVKNVTKSGNGYSMTFDIEIEPKAKVAPVAPSSAFPEIQSQYQIAQTKETER